MTIQAAYYTGHKTFTLEEKDDPAPGPGEVQIRVAFVGICGTDIHVYHGNMDARVGSHRVIGHEMSGTVSALGEGVTGVAVGDRVVVRPLDHCGQCPACQAGYTHICHKLKFLGLDTDGALQEHWNVPAHTIHKLPADMSLETAAMIEPLAVAVHDVRRARLQTGETALVIGGGPIGMLIAMVAKHVGANVILSEINPNRLRLAGEMGFTGLNPREGDVAAQVTEITGTKGADVVFEVSGTQPGVDLMTAAAATRGRICMVAIHAQKAQVDLFRFFWRELEMVGARVYEAEDYDRAIRMIADGLPVNRLITDRHPLGAVQQAFEALEGNATAMKTLIRVEETA
ncbi:Threonine dehydrogenase [Rubellimicrobium mesophilum DSM 19309]|uniref:Threonine dehydrogenase n=1 Tax=Rubellimicrobium mesophilum DSM 19309 TaxID=442562 RepID=A0A017HNG1_9RHOB|nr:alcohol dehydrogenase catalytic domain-containing protein [Rubellimicrobium mesophilum]EYD75693.1 Threonine dehydrogenase [Rubellimicrobium mesophilum DSM 19309]